MTGQPENLHDLFRDLIKEHCKNDMERLTTRLVRSILWERAKGELSSVMCTFAGSAKDRINDITKINDFITVMDKAIKEVDQIE